MKRHKGEAQARDDLDPLHPKETLRVSSYATRRSLALCDLRFTLTHRVASLVVVHPTGAGVEVPIAHIKTPRWYLFLPFLRPQAISMTTPAESSGTLVKEAGKDGHAQFCRMHQASLVDTSRVIKVAPPASSSSCRLACFPSLAELRNLSRASLLSCAMPVGFASACPDISALGMKHTCQCELSETVLMRAHSFQEKKMKGIGGKKEKKKK